MSVNTLLVLVKNNFQLDTERLFTRKNYYVIDTDYWLILIVDGSENDHKTLSKVISDEHKTDTVFVSMNDFYWKIVAYKEGTQISAVKLDFENFTKSKCKGIEQLHSIANNDTEIQSFVSELKVIQRATQNLVTTFEKAFMLPSIEGVIYSRLWQSEDYYQQEFNLKHIENEEKVNPLNIIMKRFESSFAEREYVLEKNYRGDRTRIGFIKEKEGLWYSFVFDNHEQGIIKILAQSPFASYDLYEFNYSNYSDLRNELINSWNNYIYEKLIQAETDKFESFDVNRVYDKIATPIMEKFQYELFQLPVDILEQPGMVEYRHRASGHSIYFEHTKYKIDLYFMVDGRHYTAAILSSKLMDKTSIRIPRPLAFRNEFEFGEQLANLITILSVHLK